VAWIDGRFVDHERWRLLRRQDTRHVETRPALPDVDAAMTAAAV
jgi:hypothetical protein